MTKNKKYELIFCQGVEGKCVYLNDYRIAGTKPWGGGKTIATFNVSLEDLAEAIPEVKDAHTALKSALPIIGGILSEIKDNPLATDEDKAFLQKIYDDAEAAIKGAT